MSNIFENNMNMLMKKDKSLYESVRALGDNWNQDAYVITSAKNGELIVGKKDGDNISFLNSSYNPAKEADKLMKDYAQIPDEAFLSMFGLANGTFARWFLEHNDKQSACLVFEPSIDLFMKVMHEIDLTFLLGNYRFFLVVDGLNKDQFGVYLTRFIKHDNELTSRYMEIPAYARLFPEQCKEYGSIIKDKFTYYRVQTNTVLEMGRRIGYTCIQNMRFLPGCRSGADFVNYFPKDMPVIIVAAGPSLVKNVELLREAKGKALIVVVDSAIRTVLNRGLEPDMVITVDNDKELHNFDAPGIEDVYFLTDMSASTNVLEKVNPKNPIFYSSDWPLWKRMFQEQGSDILDVFAGGSVALDAMSLVMDWGFKRIIMIGQDLAMTGSKQYADGREVNKATDFNKPTLYVKDIYGEDVLTKLDYAMFIRNIEDLAYTHPDVEFIDATEGGAFKKHTKIMTLRDAIDQYCTEEYDLTAMIEAVPKRFGGDDIEKGKDYIREVLINMKNNIRNIGKQMAQCAADCDWAANILERGSFDAQDVKELKRINAVMAKIDEKYTTMEEHILFVKIASKVDYEFSSHIYQVEEDEMKESIRLYRNTGKLYRGMSQAVPDMVSMIEECLEKL